MGLLFIPFCFFFLLEMEWNDRLEEGREDCCLHTVFEKVLNRFEVGALSKRLQAFNKYVWTLLYMRVLSTI